MNDIDVINWTRDLMLQNTYVDADIVYHAAKWAEEDNKMFDMFSNYAYHEGCEAVQQSIYESIEDYLKELGLC